MEGATNFFETSKNETRAISASIEKLATQVSRMEEKLLEEQQGEEPPRIAMPRIKKDEGPEPLKENDRPAARQPDAPPLPAEHAAVAARIQDAPPESLPGSLSLRSAGWCRGESSKAQFVSKESLCAGISVEEDVDSKVKWEIDFTEEEGWMMESEKGRVMKENTRAHHERILNKLPGIVSAKVEIRDNEETMRYSMSFSKEFAAVRKRMLGYANCSDSDVLWHIEGIARFVRDVNKGVRNLDEISTLKNLKECLNVIYSNEPRREGHILSEEKVSLEEFEEDEPEEEVDEKNEEDDGISLLIWIRDIIRETSRKNLEKTLKDLPGVFSASVKLDDEDKTLANGVAVNLDMSLDKEFEPIFDVLLRDERYDEQDLIRNLETIAKFVDDIKTGSRHIEEISQEWDFDDCIEVMKGERKNAGLQEPT